MWVWEVQGYRCRMVEWEVGSDEDPRRHVAVHGLQVPNEPFVLGRARGDQSSRVEVDADNVRQAQVHLRNGFLVRAHIGGLVTGVGASPTAKYCEVFDGTPE